MGKEIVIVELKREHQSQAWGFRVVGGTDEKLVLKVEKVNGLHTPAGRGGLQEKDVLLEVNGTDVAFFSHPQFVDLVKGERGNTLTLRVQRGDHVIPNIQECFPIEAITEKMTEEEKLAYYEDAMRRGLGSRLGPNGFTTVGKMKVKMPKYNCPQDLYSETTMDEMISGTSSIDPEKLDPDSPAFQKLQKTKKFNPKRSSVLLVLQDYESGRFEVDTDDIVEVQDVRRI